MTIRADHMQTAQPATAALWPLAALSLATLLPSLGISIANVALPTFATVFGASFQEVQWIVLAYLLATTTLIVSVGRLGDILGRRRLLLAGIVIFTAASLLCGVAPTLWLLIAGRALQGLGAAFMMALTMAFVGEVVPKARTGSAMGLLGTMSAVGTALGPTLGGALIAAFGWPAIFLVMVPLGVMSFALAYRHLPAGRAGSKVKFDIPGTLLLALTLAAYALAMTIGRGSFGMLNAALLVAAGIGIAVFLRVEAKVVSPLIQIALFREPGLGAGLATSALVMTVMLTTLVVGPFYLARALGLDPAMVGAVMSVAPIMSALTGVPAGRIVDRCGAQRMVFAGLAVNAIGCALLAALPMSFGIIGYAAPLVVIAGGYALWQAANNTAVMKDVAQDTRGVVSGLLNLSRSLGAVTGASMMGAVFAFASGAADVAAADAAAVANGMHITFAVGAGIIGVALVIAVVSRSRASL